MSAEVVKKRGRPKKVVPDPAELAIAESAKKVTTRAKSTTATKKATTVKATVQKLPSVAKPDVDSPSSPPLLQMSSAKSPVQQPPTAALSPTAEPKRATKSTATPVTPKASKFLSQVRELSAKNAPPFVPSIKFPKPSPTNTHSKAGPLLSKDSTPAAPPRKFAAATAPPPTSAKPPLTKASTTHSTTRPIPPNVAQPPPPTTLSPNPSPPKISFASLNSTIVDNISTRAGARPNTSGSKSQLPPNYRPVARKVTMAIVAMPIVIVTSWVLYQRLVLGEDRKLLVKPGLTMVETKAGTPADEIRGKES